MESRGTHRLHGTLRWLLGLRWCSFQHYPRPRLGSSAPPFTPPPEPTKHTRTTLTQTEPDFEPTPSHGPMPKNCLNFYKAEANETCNDILDTYSYISKEQFFKYDPALERNCNGLWEGNWYCVEVEDELPPLPPTTATPSPVPRGSPKDCRS